ncbi:MAG: PRC-barrel domain-containing protein [Verrucomicrobia bacterium]|nr:PRC-barrel domain-containing protein [Verrucomicrobiota bacterium]
MKSNYSLGLPAATGSILARLGWMIALGTLALRAPAAEPPSHPNYGQVQHETLIIGLPATDSENQKLGIVQDLALDVENGRVVEVIVASGGFLGLGQRTVAVPPGALTLDSEGRILHLNVDKEKFKAAPEFAMSKWAEHCQSPRVAETYRYFGQVPYFAAEGQESKSGNTATEPLGFVQRYTKLLELPVQNLQNERLGTVNAFQFDLTRGYIIHVIVLAPRLSLARNIIPARALRFNAAHDALCLDVSTQAFHNEPRFRYVNGEPGDYKQEKYSNTKVAANEGVNTRQNVQEGTVSTYTPLAQGASFRDVDKTYRIYAAIRADASLSQNAQNVEVGTLNGRTTLRGHVNTEEGKRAIGQIAANAGRPERACGWRTVLPVLEKKGTLCCGRLL